MPRTWAVADPDLLARLLADSRVSKDPRQHWPRFIAGEIVGKWPLYLQVSVDNMFTAMGNIVPSHMMDRNLYPFTTLQTTGVADPAGDKAFDEDDEGCATPAAPADAAAAPAVIQWKRAGVDDGV